MARVYACLILAVSATGAAATCTLPTIAAGVFSWSKDCVVGTPVAETTECLITAKAGYACTSPGQCEATGKFEAVGACAPITTTALSTTLTPWDSSESSSAGTESLQSSYSSSFKHDSSSDSSGSDDSSGSTASGSSGSYLRQWQWIALALSICVTCGILAALCGSKKPKKKKAAPKPVPAPVPEPMITPLMVEPLMTTSTVLPSYSMAVPAPVYNYAPQYAAPVTTAYAAPATTAYAAPVAYSTGYGGYQGGTVSNVGYNQPGLVMEQPGGYVV